MVNIDSKYILVVLSSYHGMKEAKVGAATIFYSKMNPKSAKMWSPTTSITGNGLSL